MPEIVVDGKRVPFKEGDSVAAALLNAGVGRFRRSVQGEARSPLCGMGVCFECRVTIEGVSHERSCLIPCREGLEVTTGA